MRISSIIFRGVASMYEVGEALRGRILEWVNRRGEARRAESGVGFLGSGAASPLPTS